MNMPGYTERPDWVRCAKAAAAGDPTACEECPDCQLLNNYQPEPPRKEVFYVAHPVSGDINANIANVVKWINWLTVHDPSRVYVAPWVAEVMAFKDDPLVVGADDTARKDFYDRVLEDDKEVVRRLDGILLVGGKISEGMRRERDAAIGKTIQDWSYARTPADLLPEHVEALGCQ